MHVEKSEPVINLNRGSKYFGRDEVASLPFSSHQAKNHPFALVRAPKTQAIPFYRLLLRKCQRKLTACLRVKLAEHLASSKVSELLSVYCFLGNILLRRHCNSSGSKVRSANIIFSPTYSSFLCVKSVD
jgi:hypothetical protein